MMNRLLTPLLMLSLLSTVTAQAEESTADVTPIASYESASDGSYINGGIGVEEYSAIRAQAANFPVRIQFSQGKVGKWISGVAVTVTDSKGNQVFELPDAGPLLYLKLPNGSYKLSAQFNGATLTKKIAVAGKKGGNVSLNWRNTPEDASPVTDKTEDATVTPMADPSAPAVQ